MNTSSLANRGIGLNLMRHRASLMGGSLEIESHAGQGTRVICNLPAKGGIPAAA
jgi:signal transduction histidine kinase